MKHLFRHLSLQESRGGYHTTAYSNVNDRKHVTVLYLDLEGVLIWHNTKKM